MGQPFGIATVNCYGFVPVSSGTQKHGCVSFSKMCSKMSLIFFFLKHKPINKTHKKVFFFLNQVKAKLFIVFKRNEYSLYTGTQRLLKIHLNKNLHSFDFLKGPVTISYNQVHTIIFSILFATKKKYKKKERKTNPTWNSM